MTKKEVLKTYDEPYARRYDESFLVNPQHRFLDKTLLEIGVLRRLTRHAKSWLDVACGTGYLLRHARGNRELECTGLDLSAAMLARARRANPAAMLVQADFLEPQPDFVDRWDVTSCTWGAYGLQENPADVEALVTNLAAWTGPGGTCFMPVFDLEIFEERRARGELMAGVEVDLVGRRWSFVEPDGKAHRDMVAPPVGAMTAMFEHRFGAVETFRYPDPRDEDDALPIVGIIARKVTRG